MPTIIANVPTLSFVAEVTAAGQTIDVEYVGDVIEWDTGAVIEWDNGDDIEWSELIPITNDSNYFFSSPSISFIGKVD